MYIRIVFLELFGCIKLMYLYFNFLIFNCFFLIKADDFDDN